jgi:hypothetical protein
MINLKHQTKIALVYFLLAAVLGVVLRSFHSVEIPIEYKFFVHTHSHIALLGWVYMALTTLFYKLYLNKRSLDKKYRILFWFTQLTLVGMLLSFPFQGYALFSILFSTLFLLASYWFTWFFFKNTPVTFKNRHSYICIKAALWYMVLSSLGPWVLGAIMNTLGATSIWYRLAIYFYLHFQYNAWMILALVGLLFYVLEKYDIQFSSKDFKRFFRFINLGVSLSFFLSTLWTDPPLLFNVLGGFGALFQILAFGMLVILVIKSNKRLEAILSKPQIVLVKIIAFLLAVKLMLQVLTAVPYFAHLAAIYIDFVIGYLHWVFLGVVSLGLFFLLDFFELIRIQKKALWLYILGFVFTEVLIFYKGIAIWQDFPIFSGYYEVLAIGSFLIPLALIFMLIGKSKILRT